MQIPQPLDYREKSMKIQNMEIAGCRGIFYVNRGNTRTWSRDVFIDGNLLAQARAISSRTRRELLLKILREALAKNS